MSACQHVLVVIHVPERLLWTCFLGSFMPDASFAYEWALTLWAYLKTMIWRSCIYLMRHNTTFVYFSVTRLCCDTAEVINSIEFPLPATVCKTKNHNCLLANKGWPSTAGQVDRFRVEGIVPAFIVYCVSTRVKGNISVSLADACVHRVRLQTRVPNNS